MLLDSLRHAEVQVKGIMVVRTLRERTSRRLLNVLIESGGSAISWASGGQRGLHGERR